MFSIILVFSFFYPFTLSVFALSPAWRRCILRCQESLRRSANFPPASNYSAAAASTRRSPPQDACMQPFFASFTNSIRCPHFATVRARASSQSQPLASPDVRPLIHSGDGYASILCAPDSRAFIFLSFSEKKKTYSVYLSSHLGSCIQALWCKRDWICWERGGEFTLFHCIFVTDVGHASGLDDRRQMDCLEAR